MDVITYFSFPFSLGLLDAGNSSARTGVPPTADHGQSKKRKKISDVWDYFTKISARDIDGNVLKFAACNHCCKILTGSSKGGTTHLARRTCPCKFKPVAAGRSAKDSGGDVNVLSSTDLVIFLGMLLVL